MSDQDITVGDLDGPRIDRRTTIKMLAAAGITGLAGCSSGDASEDESDSTDSGDADSTPASMGGTLNFGWNAEKVRSLDLQHSVSRVNWVGRRLYSSPLRVDENLETHGDLATDWTFENDGKRLVFDLRDDVVFHNGDEFTAEDLKFGIDRNFEEDTWRTPGLTAIDTVTAVDDTTLEIDLSRRSVPLMTKMTTSFGGGALAIPKSYYEDVGYEGFQQEPVSTGPWQVEEWNQGTRLTMTAHEDYHITDEDGNQYPYLDTVHYDSIPETSTLIGALRNGEIDMASAISAGSVPQVESANEVSVSRTQSLDWWALAFNTTREPFGTPRRRRGFAKLIDRQQFVERAQFGEAKPGVGPIPPQVPDFGRPNEEKNQAQTFAPEEGLEILEDEGIADASVELLSSPRYDRWMRNIRSQFQERAPDLNVEIRQIQQSEYWTVKGRPNLDYDISLSFTTGMFDPDGIYTFYRHPDQGGVINETGYTPETGDNAAEVNELLGEQRRTTDREERVELFHEIEDLVIEDTPDAYLMHTNDLLPIRDEVTGFDHPPNLRPTKRITLDE